MDDYVSIIKFITSNTYVKVIGYNEDSFWLGGRNGDGEYVISQKIKTQVLLRDDFKFYLNPNILPSDMNLYDIAEVNFFPELVQITYCCKGHNSVVFVKTEKFLSSGLFREFHWVEKLLINCCGFKPIVNKNDERPIYKNGDFTVNYDTDIIQITFMDKFHDSMKFRDASEKSVVSFLNNFMELIRECNTNDKKKNKFPYIDDYSIIVEIASKLYEKVETKDECFSNDYLLSREMITVISNLGFIKKGNYFNYDGNYESCILGDVLLFCYIDRVKITFRTSFDNYTLFRKNFRGKDASEKFKCALLYYISLHTKDMKVFMPDKEYSPLLEKQTNLLESLSCDIKKLTEMKNNDSLLNDIKKFLATKYTKSDIQRFLLTHKFIEDPYTSKLSYTDYFVVATPFRARLNWTGVKIKFFVNGEMIHA